MIADQLRAILVKAAGVEPEKINLEHPELLLHGDYSTNIALVVFSQTQNSKLKSQKLNSKFKNPHELAQEIVAKIPNDKLIEKVEVAGPGFINVWIKKEYLVKNLVAAVEVQPVAKKRVMLEYGDANTHKLPHIGHLFSYIYGESMARILDCAGWEVFRASYQGDIGLHVAKCLWAFGQEKPKIPKTLAEKVELLQEMYQMGSKAYDEDEKAKQDILRVNKLIYNKDANLYKLWQETRGWSVEYYKQFEKRLGIFYNRYYFESEVANRGKELVEGNVGQVFEKSDGAIVYKGVHTRVFVTGEGNPTYEAKDMGLEMLKMAEWPCDLLVITTAHEQNEYFKVVFAALGQLEPKLMGKLKHIGFGMVNLKSGKMSSRTGNVIGGIDLVDMVVAKSGSEEVGLGAIKYAFLKKGAEGDMAFDLESSIATEGNSGPYLQYTYARIISVLKKASDITPSGPPLNLRGGRGSYNDAELAILRYIYRFSEVVQEAAKRYAPNLICSFLYETAQRFNSFYNADPILGNEFRLALSKATADVLKKGLNLLGIEVLERM